MTQVQLTVVLPTGKPVILHGTAVTILCKLLIWAVLIFFLLECEHDFLTNTSRSRKILGFKNLVLFS